MSNTLRRVIIATKKAPDAIGPYNQAVQVSGICDIDMLWLLTMPLDRSTTLFIFPAKLALYPRPWRWSREGWWPRPSRRWQTWVGEMSPRTLAITLNFCPGFILEAANSTFDNVVKTTVLLADINDFAAVNAEYTKFFKSNYPARAAYQVCNILNMKCAVFLQPSLRLPPCQEGPG